MRALDSSAKWPINRIPSIGYGQNRCRKQQNRRSGRFRNWRRRRKESLTRPSRQKVRLTSSPTISWILEPSLTTVSFPISRLAFSTDASVCYKLDENSQVTKSLVWLVAFVRYE